MQATAFLESIREEEPNQTAQAIEYPESDGKPMGETDFHIAAILYLRAALRAFFRQVADVYVAADMLFYYEEGDRNVYKVPDVFVVKGIAKHDRRTYKLWEEKTPPTVIFEITSKGTRWDDTGEKKGLYAELGVQEYYLFDPLGEYLKPRLQGFRLVQGAYQPMPLAKDGTLTSQQLGFILQPDRELLRVVDPTTKDVVPTLDEAIESKAEAEARAETAEAALAQMRAEIERLKRLAGLN
ncbi:MAG: Uma2 family endonuclease [Caldilineaceae bacterium]